MPFYFQKNNLKLRLIPAVFHVLVLFFLMATATGSYAAPGDPDGRFGLLPFEIGTSPGYVDMPHVVNRYHAPDENNRTLINDGNGGLLLAESGYTDYASTQAATFLRRLDADGVADAGFGDHGLVTVPSVGSSAALRSLPNVATPNIALATYNPALQRYQGVPSANLLGFFNAWWTPPRTVVAIGIGNEIHLFAYQRNGQLDAGFGPGRDGHAVLSLPAPLGPGIGMAVHAGAITLVGSIEDHDGKAGVSVRRMLLARVSSDGMPVEYGNRGVVIVSPDARNLAINRLADVAVQPLTGQLYVCGFILAPGAVDTQLVLGRLNELGYPDDGFGERGFTRVAAAGGSSWPGRLAFQSNGRVLVGGSIQYNSGYTEPRSEAVVWAFDAHGRLDPSFADSGVYRVYFPGTGDGTQSFRSIAVDAQDQVYLGGLRLRRVVFGDGALRPFSPSGFLARLHPSGELDTRFAGSPGSAANVFGISEAQADAGRNCDRLVMLAHGPACLGDEPIGQSDAGRLRVFKFQP